MKILVYGNPLIEEDSAALKLSKILKIPGVEFQEFDSLEDFPDKNPVIMDVGSTEKPRVLKDISKIEKNQGYSTHDYDLAFQLKIMKKMNQIDSATIIVLPKKITEESKVEAERIIKELKST